MESSSDPKVINASGTGARLRYPVTPVGDCVDEFHGTRVPDPYRWLGDFQSPAVGRWTEAQNALTSKVLADLVPPDRLRARLSELSGHARWSIPIRIGQRTFALKAEGLQEQPVLYVTEADDNAPPRTWALLDPNAIAPDGSVALTGWSVDPSASLLAYALSHGGSDRQEIRIRDIATGTDSPEVLLWGKSEEDLPFPNVAWTPTGSAFYYCRLPAPGAVRGSDLYRGSQVYLHRVGTSQDEDALVFEGPHDPELNFVPIVTEDGAFLVLHAWRGLSGKHQVFVSPLDRELDFTPLLSRADASYVFLGSRGHRFYFHTNAAAPRGRVVAIDLAHRDPADWFEVIGEQPVPIARGYLGAGWIVLVTVDTAYNRLLIFSASGEPGPEVELPEHGTISDVAVDGPSGRLLVAFESFLRPKGILSFDLLTGDLVNDGTPTIPFDATPFVTERHFAPASDGTGIPVTIVHRAETARDGGSPMLLYGYGGFNVSTTPVFDPLVLAWLERGGAYAIANPRGGGEYGEAWHEAGRRGRKQTVFDDFQTVAEWLIERGYTAGSRLAIRGESNGGLLVAACMLQRPELYGAVVCSIPVTDMLRFPRFTIGHYWTDEYGDAQADLDAFEVLRRYSPLENVQSDVDYPPILVTTGDGDDRVVPTHAMKFVARLQAAATDTSRLRVLRVQEGVGHGLGKPTSKVIDLDVDILVFLLGTIGRDLPTA